MFTPRKNKNLRKKIDIQDDDPEESPAANPEDIAPSLVKAKKPKKKAPITVLSFGDEEQDAEETFKLKKKSSSRKFGFYKDGESLDPDLEPPTITSRATTGNNVSYSKEAMEELRQATQSKTPSTRGVLSEESLLVEKFPTLLEGPKTIIPDANQIFLAKQKYRQMRLKNDRDEEEFISLIGGDDDETVEQNDKRLVREEDDEMDDGEAELENVLGDRLALGRKAQSLAEKNKRAARKEMIEDIDMDEEDEEETREWEMKQIRNAGVLKKAPKELREPRSALSVHKAIAFPTVTPVPTMASTKQRLERQLAALNESRALHAAQLKQIRHEEASLAIGAVEATEAMSKASVRYTFFQELLSYCRNLAAFFEEKFPELEKIESDYRELLLRRSKTVRERRVRDLNDDLSEFANLVEDELDGKKELVAEEDEFGRSTGMDPQAAKKRRAADRDRRRLLREENSTLEHDGLATDDELVAGDTRELKEAIAELEQRKMNMLNEVAPDFKSLDAVKERFQSWKTEYRQDYNRAYGGLLLPMVFDFFVRQETCLWNPFQESQDIASHLWHQAVSSYLIQHPSSSGLHGDSDSEDHDADDEEDMDTELMSKVVAKSLCPRMNQFLADGGVDLYSHKQARCMKAILDQVLDYVDKKDNKMDKLLKAALEAIVSTAKAHRAQFVEASRPLKPRHILGPHALEVRERYLWRTIGLFRNLMLLRRFVPSDAIDTFVVDGLLHDCIMGLLEGDDKDTVAKYQMIYKALPHDIRSQERHLFLERMTQSV
ncbi:hypothetical protein BGZ94_007317 [Podila epigama]|nr:hypothetical protein BGZ94_007317 [Podila epigama]